MADRNLPAADAANPENCGNCACYMPMNDKGGLCRRRAPQVVLVPMPVGPPKIIGQQPQMVLQAQGQFPPVPAEWWCFEWVDPQDALETGSDDQIQPT